MNSEVKNAFRELQKTILLTIGSDRTSVKEANAYAKMSRLLLSIQKDYEELLALYKRVEKKPDVTGLTNRQKQNVLITLYQLGRMV